MSRKTKRVKSVDEYKFIDEGPNEDSIKGQRFSLQVKNPSILTKTSDFQKIEIYQTKAHGKALILDGVVQLTEFDEFAYHEMLAHVPLFTIQEQTKKLKVLLIGAGDGGVLRELLKHDSVGEVDHVEIDNEVVQACRTHLPNINDNAFNDPRVKLYIEDGLKYLKNESCPLYDLVIVDSSDPTQGPNSSLFEDDFYVLIKRRLDPIHGLICLQAENYWLHSNFVKQLSTRCKSIFPKVNYYYTHVPTYPGGLIGFFICSMNSNYDPIQDMKQQSQEEGNFLNKLKYYNEEVHKASFALPTFMRDSLN